jgi:heme exporter protein B
VTLPTAPRARTAARRPLLHLAGVRVLRQSLLLLRSELRQEARDFELLITSAFFTLVVLAMFYLSFGVLPKSAQLAAIPGLLWLTVAFVGALTLTRAFDREREADTLRAMLAAPVERLAIYFSKAASTLLVLLLCCGLLVPGLGSMFPAGHVFFDMPFETFLVVFLGCLGYVAIGTLFAAGLAGGGGKSMMLSVILYPITTPVLMYALATTRALLDHNPNIASYLGQMAALDVAFIGVGALLFEPVLVGAAPARPTRTGRAALSRQEPR